jgi:cytochrome c oxidase assembly protein subunit 15
MNKITETEPDRRLIAYWLLICCALVFAMVVLGGVTRLTGSGLSMVEWQPVYGILPPLTPDDWQVLFEKYQQSPEYRHVNHAMDVEGFKSIFWLEYWHRILGRVIGLVFFLPFLLFWLSGRIPPGLTPKLLLMFVLGGLQGLLGWYMVKSGLVDDPHVSQYRLTAHLLLAILVYGFMLWVALGLLFRASTRASPYGGLNGFGLALLGLIVLTVTSGGFVAGLKAGMTYNTFPLMGGQWIPDGLAAMQPWYRNLFENVTTVQFNHRLLAMLTFFSVLLFWLGTRRQRLPTALRIGCHALLLIALLQVALGISTLLLQVPVVLGSAHQAGALALFTAMLFVVHRLRAGSVRTPP